MRLALCYQNVDPRRGGAETYVVDLCRRLAARGHHVDLLVENCDEDVIPSEVVIHKVALSSWSKLGRTLEFGRRCQQALPKFAPRHDCTIGFVSTWGQDILIPQGGVRRASLMLQSRRFGSPLCALLYRISKQWGPRWWLYQEIERRQYDPRRRTRIVAVSQMVREHLVGISGVEPSRIRVIPNAIDPDRLAVPDHAAARAALRSAWGLAEDDLVGLFVGHNYRLKGLDPLLRALAQRRAGTPGARPIHLLVCGSGSPRRYRQRIAAAGLADTVRLAGFLDDIRHGFHGSDFFVLPSYYDPCSLVVFEALACGLPVITTRSNGAGELIEPGRQGFVLSHPDATEELLDALDALTDEDRRAGMSQAAGELGREQSFERHVLALEALCAEAARGGSGDGNVPAPHLGRVPRGDHYSPSSLGESNPN